MLWETIRNQRIIVESKDDDGSELRHGAWG